jgi:hypothetical protein
LVKSSDLLQVLWFMSTRDFIFKQEEWYMKKLKMVLATCVLVAVAALSVSGLVFADDTQAAPATSEAPAAAPEAAPATDEAPAPEATAPAETPAPADTAAPAETPAPETTPAPAETPAE